MAFRGGAVAVLLALVASPSVTPTAAASSNTPVVIRGVGAAHGFGMAMDGVEGQARAGWSHDRILSLFYPGTTTSNAGGTIRVGLAEVPSVAIGLPAGGVVSGAPKGGGGSPVTLPVGARVSLKAQDGGVAITGGVPTALAAESHTANEPVAKPGGVGPAQAPPQPSPPPLPTPPAEPPPAGEPPSLEPTPTPVPKKGPPPSPGEAPTEEDTPARVLPSVWVWGNGDPALVSVDATGRRYRGVLEIKPRGDKLVVVNHVDLETYVRGIAEEKGQGWPMAGLKALAIAARSLGAATMTWYTKNTANGYDICPNANCQLYLGYDGEEPAMTRAVAETAGQIRTFNGRAIMAMYHGNGGGQTESYKEAIGGGSDPHPYLTSVRYPFADPSRWGKRTTLGEIEGAVRAANIAVPGALRRIEVTKRGASPRVLRMQLSGADGGVEVSGTQFATALELRSTWFDLGSPDDPASFASSEVVAAGTVAGVPVARAPERAKQNWTAAIVLAAASASILAVAAGVRGGVVLLPSASPLRSFAALLNGGRRSLRRLVVRARPRRRRLLE